MRQWGEDFLFAVNESIKKLKTLLKDHVMTLNDEYSKTIKILLDQLQTPKTGDALVIRGYLETIGESVNNIRKQIKNLDEKFKKDVLALGNAYEKDKKGLHPFIPDESEIQKVWKSIRPTENVSISDQKKSGKDYELGRKPLEKAGKNIIGKLARGSYDDIECTIMSVNLNNGIVTVKYKPVDKNKQGYVVESIYFKNMCVTSETKTASQQAKKGGMSSEEIAEN